MNTTPRSFALASLVLALVAGANDARSQGSTVTVRSSRTEIGSVAPGGVFTAPFAIVNHTNDSIQISPVITLPTGWTTVNSAAPAAIAPNAMELWLVSVSAPPAAPAGTYVLRAGIRAGSVTVVDSAVIAIAERRELDVRSVNAPSFVLSGESYDAHFVVRNRGNVPVRVSLRATSNHGKAPTLSATQINIAGGASSTVTATVAIAAGVTRSVQDVLEILAVDMNADTVRAETSVETTIIPNGNVGPEFWTIPGQLSFRAAATGAGVSPFIASGTGRISETSDVSVDFSIHAATGVSSMFGEREEYRLGLKNTRGGVRLGDDSYGFSLLTSTGGQGTGAEVRGQSDNIVGGAYVQRNRWTPNAATEAAAMIGTSATRKTSASLVMLERGKSGMASRVMAGTAQTTIMSSHLELETAASDSQHVGGGAGIVRVYGDAPTFTYDIGGQRASNDFAGAQRASSDEHLTLSGQKVGAVMVSAMTSIHTMNPTAQSAGFGQRIATSMLTANFTNGVAVEFERFDRADRGTMSAIRGNQQSLRVRGQYALGRVDLSGDLQRGVVAQADSASTRGFTTLNASARVMVAKDQYVSMFTDVTDGRGLGAGGVGTLTAGGNTDLRLARATSLRMTGSVTAQRDNLAAWVGQGDVAVEQTVRQSIVALRARISQSGSPAIASTNALYFEVRTPLHLPTSRLNLGGRARAQVVDAATGRGVAGALVRLGEQAAITDKSGAAYFKGLALGEYHAVVDGGIAAGQLVSGGDQINVTSTNRSPVAFTMSIARGAHVAARLRRFEKNVNAAPNGVDSLTDVGAIGQAVVALISARDTMWQSSDDRGRIDFGSVAPGHYKVAVVAGDVPEFMAYEKKEIDVDVIAGEQREVELRLLPVSRPVEFVGSETVLVAAPVTASSTAPATTKPQPQPQPRPAPTPMPIPTPSRNLRTSSPDA